MYAGITDVVSKVGTTDIPCEDYMVHQDKWLWEDWTYYRERSPIYYAKKHRTPLLIAHGDADTRVHPSQSMEIYRVLKNLGQAPVRMVFYRGEPHGNRRITTRLQSASDAVAGALPEGTWRRSSGLSIGVQGERQGAHNK